MKIHLFANLRERQHFVPIGFVGGGVARTLKIIFFISIDFLIPFVTEGFNNLFFLRFDIGLKGACLLRSLFSLL